MILFLSLKDQVGLYVPKWEFIKFNIQTNADF